MKKVLAVIIAVAMISTLSLGVIVNAESKAVDQSTLTLTERFSDDFSDGALDTETKWKVDTPPSVTDDGKLQLGGSNWINEGYLAYIREVLDSDYVCDFTMSGPKNDCYWGFAVRSPETGGNPMNGGRFGIPSAAELSTGIIVDLMVKPNDGKIGVTFCDGGANAEAPTVLLDVPGGFDPTVENTYRVVDTGDKITLYINGSEYFTIVLNADFADADKAAIYAADGSELMAETDVTVLGSGNIGFYQRNNVVLVDNVVLSDAVAGSSTGDDPAVGTGITNFLDEGNGHVGYSLDVVRWNGDDVGDRGAVEAYFSGDGTLDGATLGGKSVGYYGWVAFTQEVKQFGYMINDKVVFDPAFTAANENGLADTIRGWGGDWVNSYPQRYDITAPIDGLTGTNVVCAVVELADGTIVKLNDDSVYNPEERPFPDRLTTLTIVFPGADPQPQPQTGDAAVAMIAMVAVLAMGAAVVFAKKRSF